MSRVLTKNVLHVSDNLRPQTIHSTDNWALDIWLSFNIHKSKNYSETRHNLTFVNAATDLSLGIKDVYVG